MRTCICDADKCECEKRVRKFSEDSVTRYKAGRKGEVLGVKCGQPKNVEIKEVIFPGRLLLIVLNQSRSGNGPFFLSARNCNLEGLVFSLWYLAELIFSSFYYLGGTLRSHA